MQTANSETESKSCDLSISVHHYTLRAPCPKGQGIGATSTVFKFKLNLDGRPPLRTCVKRCSCQSLSVTQQMHPVLPEVLAA